MSIFTYVRSHAVLATTIVVVAVAGTVIAGRVAKRSQIGATNESNLKKVFLADAASFRGGVSRVSADGAVESLSQVDLKSQISAPIATLNVSVGDSVKAGQTIAVLQNADIRAQLDQAKAGLQLAQGQYSSGAVSLDTSRKSAIDKIRDAYTKSDDVVHTQLAPFLLNNAGNTLQFYSLLIDSRLADDIRNLYTDIDASFRDWKIDVDALTGSATDENLHIVIAVSSKNVAKITNLLDKVSTGLSDATRISSQTELSTINGWKATVTAARNTMSSVDASLTQADSTLSNAVVSQGSSANAQISAAQATVKNLEAQLAKTVIVSPISGKIAALPLRSGELAGPGQLIATVVGGGGLQVKAYASGEDLSKIKIGARALIKGSIIGTVSSVAPSVNQSNKKVEVKILISDSKNSGLVVGDSVPVSIETNKNNAVTESYLLPIQDVKIIPGEAYVFTVDEKSKIVKHPVILGKVQGDFVEVASGITDDMKIVSPVYELEEGETVSVEK